MKVRTRFQPRELLEVDEQEAEALRHQGLLWDGEEKDLAGLDLLDAAPETASQPQDAKPAPAKTTGSTTAAPAREN